jgi:transcriptional regulator with XRE-family HTH domain
LGAAKLPPDGGSQGSLTIRRWRLGIELRQLREAAGLTVDQVAAELYCSRSKVSRIEMGRVGVGPRDIRDMLELYAVSNEQRELIRQLAHEARQKRISGGVPMENSQTWSGPLLT